MRSLSAQIRGAEKNFKKHLQQTLKPNTSKHLQDKKISGTKAGYFIMMKYNYGFAHLSCNQVRCRSIITSSPSAWS